MAALPSRPTTPSVSTPSIDQFLNLDLIDALPLSQPAIAGQADLDTSDMSFAEMFRHYLAPEVAKLPATFLLPPLPSPAATHPYASEFPLDAPVEGGIDPSNVFSYAQSFSPLDFLPTIPGSPIGGISPSSDNSGSAGLLYGSLSPALESPAEPEVKMETDDRWTQGPILNLPMQLPLILPPLPTRAPLPMIPLRQIPIVQVEPIPLKHNFNQPPARPVRQVSAPEPEPEEEEEEEEQDYEMGDEAPQDGSDFEGSDGGDAPAASTFTKRKQTSHKLASTSVAGFASATLHATSSRSTLPPVPEWTDKPDPEAYKKLNSKEKRQLRNKISARNFRHRRKEYITTLEEEISTRDAIIGQLRHEVGSIRTENKDLKKEFSLLKTQWEEMMEKMANLSLPDASFVPTSLSAVGLALNTTRLPPHGAVATDEWPLAPSEQPVASRSKRSARGIAKPNINKDVGAGRNADGSWTAGMGTGFMPVHTMRLPEFRLDPKPVASGHPFPLWTGASLNALPHANPFWLQRDEPFRSLADKEPRDAYLPSTSAAELMSFQSPRLAQEQEQQAAFALVAQLATRTLLDQLLVAVMGALAGPSGDAQHTNVKQLLAGTATLSLMSAEDTLDRKLAELALSSTAPLASPASAEMAPASRSSQGRLAGPVKAAKTPL